MLGSFTIKRRLNMCPFSNHIHNNFLFLTVMANIVNPYHPNPQKIDDFDIAGSIGHKQIITENFFRKKVFLKIL